MELPGSSSPCSNKWGWDFALGLEIIKYNTCSLKSATILIGQGVPINQIYVSQSIKKTVKILNDMSIVIDGPRRINSDVSGPLSFVLASLWLLHSSHLVYCKNLLTWMDSHEDCTYSNVPHRMNCIIYWFPQFADTIMSSNLSLVLSKYLQNPWCLGLAWSYSFPRDFCILMRQIETKKCLHVLVHKTLQCNPPDQITIRYISWSKECLYSCAYTASLRVLYSYFLDL